MVRLMLSAVLLVGLAGPAAADRWVFVGDSSTAKFGFEPTGTNNFDPVWFRCESGGIVASAAVGRKRPRGGKGSATLAAAGRTATISGPVADEEYEGVYSLETRVARDHDVFALLGSGQPVTYKSAGLKARVLAAAGGKSAAEKFLAACPRG